MSFSFVQSGLLRVSEIFYFMVFCFAIRFLSWLCLVPMFCSVCLTSFHFLRVSSLVSPVCHLLPCLLVPFPNVKLMCPFLGLDVRVTSCFILRVVLLLRSSCATSLSPWLCVLLVSKCSLLFPGHHVS